MICAPDVCAGVRAGLRQAAAVRARDESADVAVSTRAQAMEAEAAAFIGQVTGTSISGPLGPALKDGVVLCNFRKPLARFARFYSLLSL